jgi:hypothetical protein
MHQIGDAGEGNEVVLDVLAGGEVAASTAEFIGDARQLTHLLCGQQPTGDFAAHHLDARLSLAVNAVLEAEGSELGVSNLPCEDGHCLCPEGFDFLSDCFNMLILKLLALR